MCVTQQHSVTVFVNWTGCHSPRAGLFATCATPAPQGIADQSTCFGHESIWLLVHHPAACVYPSFQGDGSLITVEPGLIGGEVNRILANYAKVNKLPIQYKIGPDPSSIDSSMIGGIVNNNSSGM